MSSCDLFKDGDEEPSYTAQIAWDSGLRSGAHQDYMVYEDNVYFYERPEGYNAGTYRLTKLNAETGALVWRSTELFGGIVYCQPAVIGGYVYVFLQPNVIMCFDRETGEHSALVRVDVDNKGLELRWFATAYQDYLYLGLGIEDNYFVRLNVSLIDQGAVAMQYISPEILWEPETGGFLGSEPVVYKNVVYTSTCSPLAYKVIELAGFDERTGDMVFHKTFGGKEDLAANIPFPETGPQIGGNNPIFTHNDVLYYLNFSIAAWDLKTGKQLYRHVFTGDIPEAKTYYAVDSLQHVYYKKKIYYTSGMSFTSNQNSYRNLFCIDAATGKLVWNASTKNASAKSVETLMTNPIIANGKLYVAQFSGLRVYEPGTGKLIGEDKSFCGMGMGRNVLYKDYMICVRMDRDTGRGRLVAVYVGK
jgi:hypothetical protein